MIYVHEHVGTGETNFEVADAGTAIWKMVATFSGPRALEKARAKYPKAVDHRPLGEEGEEDPSDFEEASQIEHAAMRLERQHEPEDLKALGLQRAKRMNDYLFEAKGELRALLEILDEALVSGANQMVRLRLEELAQHHTDLENAIEGNG